MSAELKPPADGVYAIEFNTKDSAGYIKATKVRIYEDIVDLDEVVRIDLRDHPLYKKLEAYVKANPSVK